MKNRALILLIWAFLTPVFSILLIITIAKILLGLSLNLKKTNCVEYAFRSWVRSDGYILIRKSKFGWYPHFLQISDDEFSKNKKINHIGPKSDAPPRSPIDLLVFDARIKYGDD